MLLDNGNNRSKVQYLKYMHELCTGKGPYISMVYIFPHSSTCRRRDLHPFENIALVHLLHPDPFLRRFWEKRQ